MRWTVLLIAGALLSLAGCGAEGPTRYRLSGQVLANGQPVPAGVIFFDPDAMKGNQGPQGYAYIKDGRYDTGIQGAGTVGGHLIARVQGFDGQPGAELPLGKMIYGEHEISIEVPLEDATHDFDLPAPHARPAPPPYAGP